MMAARVDPPGDADSSAMAVRQGGDSGACGAGPTLAAQADDEAGGVGQDAAEDLMRGEVLTVRAPHRSASHQIDHPWHCNDRSFDDGHNAER